MKDKRVLLIGPSFYNYCRSISNLLNLWGASVTYIVDEPSGIVWKTVKHLPLFVQKKYLHYFRYKRINYLSNDFDLVLMISGGVFDVESIKNLRSKNPKAQFITYQWDSLKRSKRADVIALFDKKFSFDREDVSSESGIEYLPLFYSPEYTINTQIPTKFDIGFIGTDHGDRLFISRCIKKQCNERNLTYDPYIYKDFSGWIKAKILDDCYRNTSMADFKFKKLSRIEVVNKVYSAKAVLDVHNSGQTGITIRAFEALASGRLLITTNANVIKEPWFNPERIFIIDRTNPVLDNKVLEAIINFTPQIPYKFEKYSMENWLSKIICTCL